MTLYDRRISAWNATKQAFYDLAGVLEAVKHVSPWRLFNGFGDLAKEPKLLPFYDQLNEIIKSYGATKGAAAELSESSSIKSIGRFGASWRLSLKWTVNLFAFLVESIAAVIYAAWQLLKGVVLFVSTGVLVVVDSFSQLGLAMIEGLNFKKAFDRKSTLNAEGGATPPNIEEISGPVVGRPISASPSSEPRPTIGSSADTLNSEEPQDGIYVSADSNISASAQNISPEITPVLLSTGSDKERAARARSLSLEKLKQQALAESNTMTEAQKEVIEISKIEQIGIGCNVQINGDKKPLLIALIELNKVAILQYAIELHRDLTQKNPATLSLDNLLNAGWVVNKTKGTLLQRSLEQQSYACALILIKQGAKISSELLTRITKLKGQDELRLSLKANMINSRKPLLWAVKAYENIVKGLIYEPFLI